MYSKGGIREAHSQGPDPHEALCYSLCHFATTICRLLSSEQEVFEYRRPRELWIQQDTASMAKSMSAYSPQSCLQGWKSSSRAYFRKYWSPALLFSRNLGLNLDITLLGGSVGTAASKLGNVLMSWCRKSSNSE